MSKVVLFDSSLRDGAQAEGITFSVDEDPEKPGCAGY